MINSKLLITILFSFVFIKLYSLNSYQESFSKIENMLSGKSELNFKNGVFYSENAWYDNQLDKEKFDSYISFYSNVSKQIMLSGNIVYHEKDSLKAAAQCATFLLITDTIPIYTNSQVLIHTPFTYNFNDFAGQKDWSNMFVSTLLQTKKGNCLSLPYLYKMIMDELGQPAYLSLAPNHIYIKAQNKRVGWYNIELTCGDFPTDAWLTASGYIHTDALRNGIYMDTLSQKQSVCLCLVDLAQGYQAKFGIQDGSFILKCCETALTHFPKYINAMLLKAETLTALYKKSDKDSEQGKKLFAEMNETYTTIHQLGYRKMPQGMYLNWLKSSGTQTTNYRMKSLLKTKSEM